MRRMQRRSTEFGNKHDPPSPVLATPAPSAGSPRVPVGCPSVTQGRGAGEFFWLDDG